MQRGHGHPSEHLSSAFERQKRFFTRASAVFGPTFIGFAGHTTFASIW